MATLATLEQQGALIKLDAQLDDDEQEVRVFLMLPRVKVWLEEELPKLGSTWKIETSPMEQFDALLHDYAAGLALVFKSQFFPLRPCGSGIWELKTADLRLFGWFAKQDFFVCTAAALADLVKDKNLYHGYFKEAVRLRDLLPLDDPKFVPGENSNAVLSNCAHTS